MANLSESLTIRILGDSSGLQRELDAVARRIGGFQAELSRLDTIGEQIGRTSQRLTGWIDPLRRISSWFDRIAGQARGLAEIPISLNVAPALGALSVLSARIESVAARLRSLSSSGGGGVMSSPAVGSLRGVSQFATGGLVHGPSGRDRVPALLSAGEFVIREAVVQRLGVPFFDGLNRGQPSNETLGRSTPQFPDLGLSAGAGRSNDGSAVTTRETPHATQSNVHHYGGVTINVAQPVHIGSILRDLRVMGFRLQNRRG